jgi:tol-pal system protein YbgF
MNASCTRPTTAISTMAVIFSLLVIASLLVITGCVTKRDIEEVKRQLTTVESQNRNTQGMVARMDSIIVAGADADNKLRNEMRITLDEVGRQIARLLENYNDLQQQLDRMTRDQVIVLPPKSSPGAQADQPDTTTTAILPSPQTVDATCIDAYDVPFTLVTHNEYEKALAAFEEYFDKCANDENLVNAHYWTGECYFSLGQFTQAAAEFDLLTREFPDSPKVASALYKLARSWQELGKTSDAKDIFQRVVEEHAGTLEAKQAQKNLKDLDQ